MTVHNHGPAEGRGLDCPERRTAIGNYLRGACLPDPVEPEPYCDHGPLDACRCLAQPPANPVRKGLQCKDIPDQPILDFLAGLDRAGTWFAGFDNSVGQAMPPGTPPKLRRAKMAGLIRRGLVKGCTDGCKGNYELAADAEDMHVYAHEFDPIGGFVCSTCGTPTESEPCREHQPAAYAKIN